MNNYYQNLGAATFNAESNRALQAAFGGGAWPGGFQVDMAGGVTPSGSNSHRTIVDLLVVFAIAFVVITWGWAKWRRRKRK